MVKRLKKITEEAESSWSDKLTWTKHSDATLSKAEKSMLSYVKTPYEGAYVDIGHMVGRHDKVWTIFMNTKSTNIPIVMIHGMGAGLAFYCTNFDAISASRPVYAIDLLGFARSSRPKFSTDPQLAEEQWVQSIEEWRKRMGLKQFILLGHSLGGFLSTAYTMKYPESGEVAFYTLTTGLGWAKNPMRHRLHNLNPAVPVTLIYGTESWVYKSSGDIFHNWEKNCTNVKVKAIDGSSHHVYLDRSEVFNQFVVEACIEAENYDPLPHIAEGWKEMTLQDIKTVQTATILRQHSVEDLMQTTEDSKENTEVFKQNKLEQAKRLSKHRSLENMHSYDVNKSTEVDGQTKTILKQSDMEHRKQIQSEFYKKFGEDDLKKEQERGESSKQESSIQTALGSLKRRKVAILQKIKINGIIKTVPNTVGTVAVS
ncbi:hypothetical protein K1T71_010412 [Dendrolimus kikuchii]|uniref:Uncharacterized protein n=1 Tax=Dendrolimus kikuchii TaxID=765133 RepID=A0ACC1CRP0_9NEOP|nr:hypothetical protein K1T71_010412 [Dendrolimus kikuchii]